MLLTFISTSFFQQANGQEVEREGPNIISTHQVLIDAPIDQVWEALTADFAGIGKWASGVNHAEGRAPMG